MITQPARVIRVLADHCDVVTIPKSACPRCEAGKGCGGGILAQAFANKTYHLKVPFAGLFQGQSKAVVTNPPSVEQIVVLGIDSRGLLMASVIMYLMPLLFMIGGALLASVLFSTEDLYTVSGAVIGLLVGSISASTAGRLLIESGWTQPFLVEESEVGCWFPSDNQV